MDELRSPAADSASNAETSSLSSSYLFFFYFGGTFLGEAFFCYYFGALVGSSLEIASDFDLISFF